MFAGIRETVIVTFIIILLTFTGCGGGGSSSSGDGTPPDGTPPPVGGNPQPSKTLSWGVPRYYTDNTVLNPLTDLSGYEIYVNDSGSFDNTDIPQRIVSAVDPATHQLTNSFNLLNLTGLTRGPQYWVSLRAVATTGEKSAFSSPVSFSF